MKRWHTQSAEESIGVKYNLLTVESVHQRIRHSDGRSRAWAKCKCECGGSHETWLNSIRRGSTKGCSACLPSRVRNVLTRHGQCKSSGPSSEYSIWIGMRDRCDNPNNQAWNNYGGRGIKVDSAWDDFAVFFRDMGKRPSKLHSLDRIDNDKGYNKNNCRWTTRKEQNRNSRHNRLICCNGESLILQEWADRIGVNRTTIYRNIYRCGGNEEMAIKQLLDKAA